MNNGTAISLKVAYNISMKPFRVFVKHSQFRVTLVHNRSEVMKVLQIPNAA